MSKKNEWRQVSFADIMDYITREEISKIAFTRQLGITNSTFHNWKNSKSVPDEPMQEKIASMIRKKKTKTKASGNLDALKVRAASSPRAATAAAKKAGGKRTRIATGPASRMKAQPKGTRRDAVTRAIKASAPVKRGRKAATNGNGHSNGNGHYPSERAALVAIYVQSHNVRDLDEYASVIEKVTAVTA